MKSAKRLCCLALAFAMNLTTLPLQASAQTDSLLSQNAVYSPPSTIQPLQPMVDVRSEVDDPAHIISRIHRMLSVRAPVSFTSIAKTFRTRTLTETRIA